MKKKLTLTVLFLFFLLFGFLACNKEKIKEELKAAATAEDESEEVSSDLKAKSLNFSEKWEVKDKYEFPDISEMNDWWSPTIIQDRLAALQMPEAALATISTKGLLETCLEFPYLLDISFYNDYQHGFNAVVENFNGFRELLKRPDLINALIEKYYWVKMDIEKINALSLESQGYFAVQHFVLEFMLAQDVVFKNLNAEQEAILFLLVLEHKELKSNYNFFRTTRNELSTYLLYAKEIMKDNAAGDYANELSELINAPSYVNPNTFKYVEDYVKAKYK